MQAKSTSKTSVKRLYLSSSDKKLTGLCGGVAEYFEIDSSLVRLGWIIFTVLTGMVPGVIAYIIAAIVIPREPSLESEARNVA